MANPTTNYSFVLPTSTDLVTDLPADFDVALQGVDTRLKALQPGTTAGDLAYSSATANTNVRLGIGTTGQVLAVVAGVPAWATTADQTPLTTKGDLFTFSTVDARLPVGTNGQVLTADSSEATGLKFATPAAGSALTLVRSQTFTTASSVDLSDIFSTTYDNYLILGNYQPSQGADLRYRYRVSGTDNSTSNYNHQAFVAEDTTLTASRATSQTLGTFQTGANDGRSTFSAQFFNPFLTQTTSVLTVGTVRTSATMYRVDIFGGFNATTSFTGLTLTTSAGTATGTVRIYGIANA